MALCCELGFVRLFFRKIVQIRFSCDDVANAKEKHHFGSIVHGMVGVFEQRSTAIFIRQRQSNECANILFIVSLCRCKIFNF